MTFKDRHKEEGYAVGPTQAQVPVTVVLPNAPRFRELYQDAMRTNLPTSVPRFTLEEVNRVPPDARVTDVLEGRVRMLYFPYAQYAPTDSPRDFGLSVQLPQDVVTRFRQAYEAASPEDRVTLLNDWVIAVQGAMQEAYDRTQREQAGTLPQALAILMDIPPLPVVQGSGGSLAGVVPQPAMPPGAIVSAGPVAAPTAFPVGREVLVGPGTVTRTREGTYLVNLDGDRESSDSVSVAIGGMEVQFRIAFIDRPTQLRDAQYILSEVLRSLIASGELTATPGQVDPAVRRGCIAHLGLDPYQ